MFPALSTERFLLRQVLPEDQFFIFQGLSHPQVIPFYGVRYDTLEGTGAQMEWYDRIWKEGTGIPWLIEEKSTGLPAGTITVYLYKPEHRKAEIGFWLLPEFWHRGVAMESIQAVLAYWQLKKNLHRIEAFVEAENTSSSRLLQRLGFHHEGTLKDAEIKNGRFISLLIYALIFPEK